MKKLALRLKNIAVLVLGAILMAFFLAVAAGIVAMPLWGMAAVGVLGVANLGLFFKGLYDRRDIRRTGSSHV